ncbi:MAG: peptidoglycan D,D-transpeptidase FtsI family protein, partial [Gaiellales bacterium]
LLRKADPAPALRLQERQIEGLGFSREERRIYPQRSVGAEVVGFAGLDNEGLEGVEAFYDEALAGESGRETKVIDPFGRTINVVDKSPVRDGHDLYLTLDHRLQSQVERILRKTRAYWRAKAATAVILDPRTGEVLAMASEPGFDPSALEGTDSQELRNRAVTDTYEPGSTFKVVTVAAALQEGAVTPSSSFVLAPEIEVADRTIREASPRPTETMTVSDIIARSSNVGAITLALRLGDKRVADWINRFGFGSKTGIDFPGESEGIVLPREKWSGSTIGNLPIGQGLAATPLQVASLYATIANGGKRVRPHLVARVDGPADLQPEPESQRIVSKKTATQVSRMLERVVTSGSGTLAQVPGYRIAGKTGTSAKVEQNGVYSTRRYVASFVGFVPARSPRLVVLVAVDEPHQDIFGGKVAAPAFAEITAFAVQYLEIPPEVRGSRRS